MKNIFVKNSGTNNSRPPFWQPWGGWGYAWRYLVFLLLLSLFCSLFFLLRDCQGDENDRPQEDPIEQERPYRPDERQVPDSLRDLPPVVNPYEPERDSLNIIPEPDPRDIVQDPDSMDRQVVGNALNVLIDAPNAQQLPEIMEQWMQKFKEVYPDDAYQVVYRNPNTGFLQINVPADQRPVVKREINEKMPEFQFIVFDEEVMPMARTIPNDPIFEQPEFAWWYPAVQLFDAWDITMGSEDVVIGIVDSYFDLRHPDFRNKRILSPYCLDRHDGNVMPPNGCEAGPALHGCNVASIACGTGNNGAYTCGVAPNCTLLPVSVMMSGQDATTSLRMAEAVMYCVLRGADVINLSLGGEYGAKEIPLEDQIRFSQQELQAEEKVWDYVFQTAERHNCVMVWAAGNATELAALQPHHRSEKTLRVSAVDTHLRPTDFTNYGHFPDQGMNCSTVSAPGVKMAGAAPIDYAGCDGICIMDGTSQAAPVVTGAVALMKSLDRSLTPEEIINILVETGKPVEARSDSEHIGPVIQIRDALLRVQNRVPQADDIFNDPTRLVGLWQNQSQLFTADTNMPLQMYFNITSPTAGIIYEVGEDGTIVQSPISISVNAQRKEITVRSAGELTCSGSDFQMNKLTFLGKADEQGRLSMTGTNANSGTTFTCRLASISSLHLTCKSCGDELAL